MSFQQRANIFEDLRFRVRFNDVTVSSSKFSTPNLKSFNITSQRGDLVSKASLTLRVRASDLSSITAANDSTGDVDTFNQKSGIIIEGNNKTANSGWKKLFTGMIKSINIRRDILYANSYIVDIQAVDIMHVLQDRTYTRRVKDDGMGVFALITGVEQKSVMGRYQQANGGGVGRAGGRLDGTGTGGGFGSSSISSSKFSKRGFVKKSTFKKSASTAPDPNGLTFLSDSLSLVPRGNLNSMSCHKIHDRGWFKQSTGTGGSGAASQSGTANTIRITPPVIMLEPEEEYSFKCASDSICAPPAEDSQNGNAYTWSVLTADYGILIDGPGGSPLTNNVKDTDFPAAEEGSVWYRHLAIGKQYNEVILTDNINNITGSAVIIGFPVHKHADMKEGGPAFGVYATTSDENA